MRPRQIYGFGNAEQRSQREREKLKQKPISQKNTKITVNVDR